MQRYLLTTEAKHLHNELIRAILYNAHFAMRPPENVELPPYERPIPPPKPLPGPPARLERPIATNTAIDLRHLPSVSQLSERIGRLIGSKKLVVDKRATLLICRQTKRFALDLLEHSCTLMNFKNGVEPIKALVTTHQLLHVLAWHRELASVISPAVFTKYGNIRT
jgi:hypothetical protein